jgi:hypothetical protein
MKRKRTPGHARGPLSLKRVGLADLPVGAAGESEREQRPYCNGNTLDEVHEPPPLPPACRLAQALRQMITQPPLPGDDWAPLSGDGHIGG